MRCDVVVARERARITLRRSSPQPSEPEPETCIDQRRDQRGWALAANAAQLQIRAIGQLRSRPAAYRAPRGDGPRLSRAQLAARRADAGKGRRRARRRSASGPDTPRAARRAASGSSGGSKWIQEDTGLASREAREAVNGLLRHRYTPPELARTNSLAGRSPGWQVVVRPAFPVETSGQCERGLAAYSCGGSHRFLLCSLLGPEGHRRTVLCLFSDSTTMPTLRPAWRSALFEITK